MERSAEQDPRVYFAAERTLLAWIRTGFAVSRFGLFLRQISAGQAHLPAHTTGLSLWSGVALVGLGILVNVSSVLHYLQTVRQLRSGTWIAGRVSTNAVILAIVLAAIGLGMAIYLLLVR
jgi:putative membrane protein